MTRNSKKKLAIFASTSKCLIYAEAKYCASETPGDIKYYECPKTEYCCAFGCCVSPGLHFHHLWYYWILVIIMFLVCSGGGWWYRYWLQGRYRAAASAIPTRSSNTRSQNSLRNASCQAQQARITYNSARNTVLLHRMWKGPQRNGAAPWTNGSASTSTHYQNMNVVWNDSNCPYYQLYGPPPSYETVIAQTRGKISNPASPESSVARLNPQSANVIPNPSVPQCFYYPCNSPARLVNSNSNQCQSDNANSRQFDSHESVPIAHFSQYCAANGATGQNMCVPLECPEESVASGSSSFTHSCQSSPQRLPGYPIDTENTTLGYQVQNAEEHVMLNVNAATGGCREQNFWHANHQSLLKVHGKISLQNKNRASQPRCVTSAESHSISLKSEEGGIENERALFPLVSATQGNFPRERTDYGGSLRLPRRHTGDVAYQGDNFQRVSPKKSSSVPRNAFNTGKTASESAPSNASSLARAADVEASSSQSNPSNNVILESFIFENAQSPSSENIEEARDSCAMNRSTNLDFESKHKLDRSKSLD